MKMRSLLWMLLAILVGCASEPSQSLTDHDSSLIVLDGAERIEYVKNQGNDQLTYYIEAEYPAATEIHTIKNTLLSDGWIQLEIDSLSPEMDSPLDEKWITFIEGSRDPDLNAKITVHQWTMDFKSDDADIVRYIFRYEYPVKGEENFNTLTVVAIYMPEEIVKEIKNHIQKELKSPNKAL